MRQTTILCTAALLAAAFAPVAFAQTALYSNASPDPSVPALATGPVSGSGVPAPAGFQWSELQGPSAAECNMLAGVSGHPLSSGAGTAYRFADDVTVPDGAGWDVSRIAFFAYQTGAPSSPPPFTALSLRIWNADPALPGAQVVFGDATTDRLDSITPTNLYRILNSIVPPLGATPDTSRLIWRLEADTAGLHLQPGTYWLDWQITPADENTEAFVPPVTLPGVRTQPGFNARQLHPGEPGAWLALSDAGKPATAADVPLDLPFILLGSGGCPADWNADGNVNSSDISAFLTAWLSSLQNGDLVADFNADEQVNSSDISAFLTGWLAAVQGGC